MKRLLIALALLLNLLGVLPLGTAAAQSTGQLRLIHAVPEAPAVDVYINGSLVSLGLEFGTASPHLSLAAGTVQVDIRPTGAESTSPALFTNTFDLPADFAFSLVLHGNAAGLSSTLMEDALVPIAPGTSRLTALLVAELSEALTIVRDGNIPLMTPVTSGQPYGSISIPAGPYELAAASSLDSTQILAAFPPLSLQSGLLYSLIITGAGDDLVAFAVSSPVDPNPGDGWVRFVHAISDAPAVDIYLNESLILANVAFGQASEHLALPGGAQTFSLRAAGSPADSEALLSEELSLVEGYQTIGAIANDSGPAFQVFVEDISDLSPMTALARGINFSAESVTFSLGGQETALEGNSISEAFSLTPASGDPAIYGGTLYTVIFFEGGDSLLALTPILFDLNSLPGASGDTAAPAPVEAAALPTLPPTSTPRPSPTPDNAAPVLPPTVAPTQEVAAVIPPTVAPTQEVAQAPAVVATTPPAPAPAQPTVQSIAPGVVLPNAAPTRPGIYPPVLIVFGVVNVNQGVNLQCREYPSSQARSLGLVPSNQSLTIRGLFAPRDETGEIGRTDAIVIEGIPDFSAAQDEDFDFKLPPVGFPSDFDVDALWLNVDWLLEDGTAFGCWVNAQYVQVTLEGKRVETLEDYMGLVKGKNVDLSPYNIPGGPREEGVIVNPAQLSAPTPQAEAPIRATVNVNPGVNLQIRRTPGVTGESLALVPGGAQLTVLGQTTLAEVPSGGITRPEWLLVQFLDATNITVQGWVAAEYAILTKGGRTFDLAEVPVVETIEPGGYLAADGVLVGEITQAVPGAGSQQQVVVPQATAAPATPQIEGRLNITPGQTLNLRDLPRTDGLVRLSLTSEAVLIVNGRNGSGEWLDVSYAGPSGQVSGWVAASFVNLTLQGAPYSLQQVRITTGEADTYIPPSQ